MQVQRCLADGGQGCAVRDDTGDVGEDGGRVKRAVGARARVLSALASSAQLVALATTPPQLLVDFLLITPPEKTNTGLGFNRGSGGGARGSGVASKNG